MNHHDLEWLQKKLSRIFSRLTGEEVRLTPEETLHIVLAINRTTPERDPEYNTTPYYT